MSDINENELLDETSAVVEDTAAEAENAEASATETVAEAVKTTETAENVETAVEESQSEVTEQPAAESNVPAEQPVTPAKSSKSSIVIFVCALICLVALVIGFIVLIQPKMKAEKEDKTQSNTVTATTDSGSSADNQSTSSANETTVSAPEVMEYNISVKLGQYKGLVIDYPDVSVSEDAVDRELDAFVQEHGEDVAVTDRGVRVGDTAVIDFAGYKDGVAFDGGSGSTDLVIGSNTFIPGFEDALVGAMTGEKVVFDITFPENYQNAELAGQLTTFEVTVNEITNYVVPELTDEFIAENTDCADIASYREQIRAELLETNVENADSLVQNNLIDMAIANAEFGGDVDAAITAATQSYMYYYDQMAQSYYGIDGATLFAYFYGLSEDQYKAMMVEQADRAVKSEKLLLEIAKEENFEISDEEFKAEFESVFLNYYGFENEAEVYAEAGEEEAKRMVNESIYMTKAENLIYDSAVVNK